MRKINQQHSKILYIFNMQNKTKEMSQGDDCTIYVADLPADKDESGKPYSTIEADFLRYELFKGYQVSESPDSVTIQTKTDTNGSPIAYALIKFDTHESAMKAVADLNYTKLDNIPIRLIPYDEETQNILHNNQGKLFIKNLDPNIEVSQLHDAFASFGEILTCKIPTEIQMVPKPGAPGELEKKYISRGHGYVQFRNQEDAKQAMTDLKGASINGRQIEIQPYSRRQKVNPKVSSNNCCIKNIPEHFTEEDLKNLFVEFGTPVSYKIMKDENGKSKKFGFVSMSNHEEAVQAVENLNNRKIEDQIIKCEYAIPKQDNKQYNHYYHHQTKPDDNKKYNGRNLYVRNFDETVTDDELVQIFSHFGEVVSAKVIHDEEGNSKKYGFVCFKTVEEASNCLKKQILIHDKKCFVAPAVTKDQRSKSNMTKQGQRKGQNNQQSNIMPPPAPAAPPMPYPYPYNPQMAYNMQYYNPQMYQQYYNQQQFYQPDPKSILRNEITNRSSNSSVLLQRLHDMSEEQARKLASDKSLFERWMNQQ